LDLGGKSAYLVAAVWCRMARVVAQLLLVGGMHHCPRHVWGVKRQRLIPSIYKTLTGKQHHPEHHRDVDVHQSICNSIFI